MTSTQHPLQDFILTPQQQSLLFAALNSNRPSNAPTNLSPLQFDGSPVQPADGPASFQGSPEFDYDYDVAGPDSSFDFSFDDTAQPKMIGDLPGAKKASSKSDSPESESPEKRSRPDDGENSGAKRRESEEKVAKKPGRKPLTTEPSSKRKAQNRAAQRAFRERKEKHLRDLENKVHELEKLSETANNEKEALRAEVDRMTVQLNEYKKRLTLLSSGRPVHQGPAAPFGAHFVGNLNDVDFQFEFPKFGSLPGPPTVNFKRTYTANSASLPPARNGSDHRRSSEKSQDGVSPGTSASYSQVGLESQTKGDFGGLSSCLFAPSLSKVNPTNGLSIGGDSHYNLGGAASTSSPSASSNSNVGGASSSCGTSPEPLSQSPMGFKPVDTLATIGEEHPSLNPTTDLSHFAGAGVDDFTQWLPQSDFEFDPQLFGDYREPQNSVLSHGVDDSYFNDAFDMDFPTPYNLPMTGPATAKRDLIAQIDAAKEADETVPGGQVLTCPKIWEKLQNCPRVQNGDFDLDGLCSDLQKKAKCSGAGAVVNEEDFHNVVKKYLYKDQEASSESDAAAATGAATIKKSQLQSQLQSQSQA